MAIEASTARPGPRSRMRGEERRTQILDAAAELVRRKGAAALTMDGLAAQAGVSKPLVYMHFPNTPEVLLALMRREHELLDAEVTAALARATTFEERLDALTRPYFHMLTERGSLFHELVVRQSNHDVLERWQVERRSTVIEFVAAVIREEFRLPPRRAALAAAAFLGAFESLARSWADTRGVRQSEAEELFRRIVRGGLEELCA